MTRLAALGCSALLASLFAASACSEDSPPPLDPGNENGGEASGGSANRGGTAGRGGALGEGGDERGGASPGGAVGAEGGDAPGPSGGAGAGGEPPGSGGRPMPPPPDLVTSSGGPWPDSATGLCSNGETWGVCPQNGDAFFGQDGTYRINVPTYVVTTNTLRDEVTGLVWQLGSTAEVLTQAEALTYCDELELGEQADWRLPTRLEYVSLLDEGKGAGYALPAGMPPSSSGLSWTSSASAVTPGLFFVVNDEDGTWNVVVEESQFSARCVRGEARSGTLEAEAGVVTDTSTGLTWQATEPDAEPRTWQESLEYCEALDLAGEQDWRLPSIKEFATVVDESATSGPVLAAALGAGAARRYWSSTPGGQSSAVPTAFALDTDFGTSVYLDMGEPLAARCVRTAD